jgi:hypothetical protein
LARLEEFAFTGTHRLVPAKYGGESVLESLPLPAHVLADLSELDAVTNERKTAERGGNSAIGPGELLFGVPEAHIVNAAFSHPGPHGGRFHSSQRGAWYAGVEIETSIAEVAFRKRLFLREGRIRGSNEFDYIEFLADFSGAYHTLDASEKKTCLRPDPVPQCYEGSQILARKLLFDGSNGIVCSSVRRLSGTCIACFRPALVFHPRRGHKLRLTIDADMDDLVSVTIPDSSNKSTKS